MTAPSETNRRYTIKPLVWEPYGDNGWRATPLLDSDGNAIVAYHIDPRGKWGWWCGMLLQHFKTIEAAQAAAEQNYRDQLLTALEEA